MFPTCIRILPACALILFGVGAMAAGDTDPQRGKQQGISCIGFEKQRWVLYRFSPSLKKWQAFPSPLSAEPRSMVLHATRNGVAVVLYPEKRCSGWFFNQAEKWVAVPESPIGDLDAGNRVVAIIDHRILVWGLPTAPHGAILDTSTMKWTATPPAPIAPRHRALQAIIGSKVLIWGGYLGFAQERADGAIFDVATGSWKLLAEAPVPFMYGMGSGLWRNRFAVFGGWNRELGKAANRRGALYDLDTNRWERMPDSVDEIGVSAAVAISGDRMLVWGGKTLHGMQIGGGDSRSDGLVYDFAKRVWFRIPHAPISPRVLALASASGPEIIVWGGWEPSGQYPYTSLTDGARFNLTEQKWLVLPSIPHAIPQSLHPGW